MTEQASAPPTEEQGKVSIKITDIYVIAQAMEKAIKRKIFTEDEIKEIYPSWSSVIRFCEDVKRKTEVEELYKKEEPKLDPVAEESNLELPVVEEVKSTDS